MQCVIFSSVVCLALQHFSTLSRKRNDFGEKKLLNIRSLVLFSLPLLSETFLILRRTERAMIKNAHWSSCKVLEAVVRF